MNQQPYKPKIRRILVALDSSPHSQAALEAAATLSALLEAELLGVFVEDINLLRLAQLPFAHELRYPTAARQKLDLPEVEQQLAEQAEKARRALALIAAKKALRYSFQVARGLVAATLMEMDVDLVVLGRVGHSPHRTARLGSTAQTAVTQNERSVLLAGKGATLAHPPLFIYDGTVQAQQTLTFALKLGEPSGRLSICIIAANSALAAQYEVEIDAQRKAAARDVTLQIRHKKRFTSHVLNELLHTFHVGLLILTGQQASRLPKSINNLLTVLELPVLVLREPGR